MKIHGTGARRKWITLLSSVDDKTQEIVAFKATNSTVADSTVLEELLNASPKTVKKLFADGAYDGFPSRKILYDRGIEKGHTSPRQCSFQKGKRAGLQK